MLCCICASTRAEVRAIQYVSKSSSANMETSCGHVLARAISQPVPAIIVSGNALFIWRGDKSLRMLTRIVGA